jgi:LAO/AO transport system kinase
LLFSHQSEWIPRVITASAVLNKGISETWAIITEFTDFLKQRDYFEQNRVQQSIAHMHEHFNTMLRTELEHSDSLQHIRSSLEQQVGEKQLSPTQAGMTLFEHFRQYLQSSNS